MARVEQDVVLRARYHLVRKIASGGMGSVWEAEDEVLHRRVAVKVLSDALAEDERFVERFRREARAAASLSHPNVASVFDFGEDSETPFIVMELIDGETLADRLAREGALAPEEAGRVAAEVADALQCAHDAGIVHRDVKPGNVMLTRQGDVKVMDFGIAAASWASPLTATGSTMGTATYISPEQAGGRGSSAASDVYSLGVVLFEMLSGRPPFTGDNPVAVATAHIHDPPPTLGSSGREVPPAMIEATHRALQKEPDARPAPSSTFAAMLRAAAKDGGEADATAVLPVPGATAVLPAKDGPDGADVGRDTETVGAATPPRGSRGLRGAWIWLAAALALVLVTALIAGLIGGDEPRPKPSLVPTAALTVPRLVGLPVDQAIRALVDRGLRLEAVRPAEGEPDVVVDSDPAPGSTVEPGTGVTLFVGTQPVDSGNGEGDEGGGDGKGKDKKKVHDKGKGKGKN